MSKRDGIIGIIIVLLFLGILGCICLIHKEADPYDIQTKEASYRKLPDGTLKFARYKGDGPEVNIPETVKGKEVTQIGAYCFHNFQSESGVRIHIPDTVMVIGDSAFEGCRNLTITGGKNVREIENFAFADCSFAAPFPFSNNLERIGWCAFKQAENLGEIHLNERLKYIGASAFYEADVEQVEIPANIEYIGLYAFEGTKWMEAQEGYLTIGQDILFKFPDEETIIIPEGVRTVSISSISDYEKVKNIYITPGVQVIETPMLDLEDADDIDELKIYIPASVHTIGNKNKIVRNGMEKVTFIVEAGSYAEDYAKQMSEEYQSWYKVVDKIDYPQ